MQGKVKWYNSKEKYGFIVSTDGEELTVLSQNIIDEDKNLKEEESVEFEIQSMRIKNTAIKVTRIIVS